MGTKLRFGTSSWSDKSWIGPFYPGGTKAADFLGFYSTQFSTVEVDATYYGIPAQSTVEGWERKLPEGFAMAAKFPREIVHAGEKWIPNTQRVLRPEHVGDATQLFLERMGRLGSKCGPLVLQFPWFGPQAHLEQVDFMQRLEAFLEALPADFRYAVEVRNRQWIGPELLQLCQRQRVAFVWSELANMAHPADLARRLPIQTTDFVYARLIGDRKAVDRATKTFDRVVLDKDADLRRWAALLAPAAPEGAPESYVYANNHYAGHGPGTIRRLQELVAGV
jgi:uncharacterized protein YecE (DUF72 family)